MQKSFGVLREAARAYIQKKERWDDIFALGNQVVEKGELTSFIVAEEILLFSNRQSF